MYIAKIPNRNSPPAYLLRETYREGRKVKNRTLANLTSLSDNQIEAIRLALKGESLVPAAGRFEVMRSRHHGHVEAVRIAMQRLGFANLIANRASRERNIIMAMVATRIIEPCSKLATIRTWESNTIEESFCLNKLREDDLYEAMDWLIARQPGIEKRLAARHLHEGSVILFDLTSSYFEGTKCPLAAIGYNRDGKKGKLQVNYGILTDSRGCPVAVSVFEGNTADPETLLPQVKTLRDNFGIKNLILVGDRGMISQKQIDVLKDLEGIDWISALRSISIRNLVETGALQMGLFDEHNLFELTHPDYPGERLVVCRNMELAKLRAHKRKSLIDSTAKELKKICAMTVRGALNGSDKIGVRVGKIINKYKVAKHFIINITGNSLSFRIDQKKLQAEAALDGIYVIRTSLSRKIMPTNDVVLSYKLLSQIERDFRSLKTVDLQVRPIYHRLSERVQAHLLICVLALYVEWHMREALRPLIFSDEDLEAKKTRDPIAPAKRSLSAMKKVITKSLDDGSAVHSFRTLLNAQSAIVKNTCRVQGTTKTFDVITTPSVNQQKVYDLLKAIKL